MDRDTHVRAARRRQALEALQFERERDALLVERLEETLAEIDGPRLDAEVYARMSPDDVQLVRAALGNEALDQPELELELGLELEEEEEEEEDDSSEEEVARLLGEVAESRRRQIALERYLELLDGQRSGAGPETVDERGDAAGAHDDP